MTTAIQQLDDAQLCEIAGGVARVIFQDCFVTMVESGGGGRVGYPGTCFGTPKVPVGTPVQIVNPPKQPKQPKR
ncbi:hypothetical protein GGR34_001258 [Microvirga flocculans]|uniref:Uncharacterized protein n=1 Tax=Microvirga flocculans TaxID=217168 RepID=A0A7W6N7G5_9HYPH|nr:hypothetical protein [Microvirga flocculans]MBB4039616.1 hypothetical protein [Microvirga flocculans]